MAEALVLPVPVPEPSHRAGSEIANSRPASNDRGFVRIAQAVNALVATRRGELIADVMDPAEMPLTPSDPLVIAGIHRRWMIKTPTYLDMVASAQVRVTLALRLAKAAGAGWQLTVYVNNVLRLTYNVAAGALTEQYVVASTTIPLDDTLDYQEIRIEQTAWHGGAAATDYVRGVFLYVTDGWTTHADQSDGWRDELYPVPHANAASSSDNDASCASWFWQAAQDLLTYLWKRSLPTLYAGTGEVDMTGSTEVEKVSRIRAEVPLGVTTIRVWAYVTGFSASSQFTVDGYTVSQASTKPGAATLWKYIDYNVQPRGAPLLDWGGEDIIIWSVCAYCNDATYGG
jgi:hypothetical protein